MFSALVQFFGLFLLKETYHPVLLNRQASQMKKEMNLTEDSERVQTIFEIKGGGKKKPAEVFKRGMTRPFVLIFHEPILQVITVYMSLLYGVSPIIFS
jgi:hypothetical protein